MSVKTARENKGMSQEAVARAAKVSQMTIYRVEKGRYISRNNAERIADALGIPFNDIEWPKKPVKHS